MEILAWIENRRQTDSIRNEMKRNRSLVDRLSPADNANANRREDANDKEKTKSEHLNAMILAIADDDVTGRCDGNTL